MEDLHVSLQNVKYDDEKEQLLQSPHKEDQSTQPFFNNQNTILMVSRSIKGYLMIMHETRIFYFKYDPYDFDDNLQDVPHDHNTTVDFAHGADHIIQLILGILTTRKYRLLTSFYLLWHVLDYLILVVLIVILFFDEDETNVHLYTIVVKYIGIFIVVGMEIFYDVLEYIVKIWILNRISLYIGVLFYILYGTVFYCYDVFDDPVATYLFILRFISFVFEVTTDYCIDLELEFDFQQDNGLIHEFDPFWCCCCCQQWFHANFHETSITFRYVEENNMIFPKEWEFSGSKVVWTWDNTLAWEPIQKENICKWYRGCFYIMFGITYFVVGIPLLIVMAVIVPVLTVMKKCFCCVSGETICDECVHPNSY